MEEPEQTAPPASGRRFRPPAHPRPPDEGGEDAASERTSPFPYSESFDEWVADETADPDRRQHGREAGSGDGSTS